MKKKPREMICGDCFLRFPDWEKVRDHVRIGKNGKQYCRACTRENVKKFYAKNPGYNNKYGNERQKRYYAKKKAEREKLQVEQNQQSDN